MKEFFLILFFSKSVLLTPIPIVLDNDISLVPEDPISAITTGASLEIDVSNILIKSEKEGILEFRDRVKKLFPPHTISASLIQTDGNEIILSYTGGHSFNHESTRLSLYSEGGVPTDKKFTKVVVRSKSKIKDVSIYWKNYKH